MLDELTEDGQIKNEVQVLSKMFSEKIKNFRMWGSSLSPSRSNIRNLTAELQRVRERERRESSELQEILKSQTDTIRR